MRVGTKSILFGVHCFFLHPWFVAAAWWKLFGFPWDLRLWISFFVHDLGYFGKPNMDGLEGETHVEFGARLMRFLFGLKWGNFCLYHSRFRAKQDKCKPSHLCIADKLAIALTPAWLYLPMARLSGEIIEYMALAQKRTGESKYASMKVMTTDERQWFSDVQEYCKQWALTHKDGTEDTWTPKFYEVKSE